MERSGLSGSRRVGRVNHSDEVSVGVLRGSHPTRIDDKGRLKVPNSFRQIVEAQWGTELFVTSVTGEFVRVYPMGVWLEIERKLAEVPSTHPSKLRFLDRVNFFGQARPKPFTTIAVNCPSRWVRPVARAVNTRGLPEKSGKR